LRNLILTGSFDQPAYFGNDTLFSNAYADLFIAKYNKHGDIVWVRQPKASYITVPGHGITLNNNNVYVTGTLKGMAVFGSDTVNSVSTNGDMFAARYDSGGTFMGLAHVVIAEGSSVCVDNSGSVFVTGGFYNTVTFGSNPSLSSHGQFDIFIAKSSAVIGIEEHRIIVNNQLLIYANPTTGICNVTIPDEFQKEKHITLNPNYAVNFLNGA